MVSPSSRSITRNAEPSTAGSSFAAPSRGTGTPLAAAARNSAASLLMPLFGAPGGSRRRMRGETVPSASTVSNDHVSLDAPPDRRRRPLTSAPSRRERAAARSLIAARRDPSDQAAGGCEPGPGKAADAGGPRAGRSPLLAMTHRPQQAGQPVGTAAGPHQCRAHGQQGGDRHHPLTAGPVPERDGGRRPGGGAERHRTRYGGRRREDA